MKHASVHRQRGQSLVETCVVLVVFGTLLLGILQAILFYRAKTVLDYAALEAARSGANNGAEKKAMEKGLARGLMPLYAKKTGAMGANKAYLEALAAAYGPQTEIEVISPTRAAFDDWKETQFDGVQAIPNDSLAFRPTTPRNGVSVQDANVLKIRVVYGYKMIVPVIDKIVIGTFRTALYKGLNTQEIAMLESGRLPIVAQAVVRMQSPIRDRNLLADAPGGGGTPPGGGSGAGGEEPPGDGGTGGGDQPPGSGGDGGSDGSPDHVCI